MLLDPRTLQAMLELVPRPLPRLGPEVVWALGRVPDLGARRRGATRVTREFFVEVGGSGGSVKLTRSSVSASKTAGRLTYAIAVGLDGSCTLEVSAFAGHLEDLRLLGILRVVLAARTPAVRSTTRGFKVIPGALHQGRVALLGDLGYTSTHRLASSRRPFEEQLVATAKLEASVGGVRPRVGVRMRVRDAPLAHVAALREALPGELGARLLRPGLVRECLARRPWRAAADAVTELRGG